MNPALAAALGGALAVEVRAMSPLSGGDVAESYRVGLADGDTVFAKTHAAPPAGFFSTEAAGLAWLRDADAVLVPGVRAVSDGPVAFLALDWIDQGAADPGSDSELGGRLARLHRAGAPGFGREDRRTTGSLGLPNDPAATWAEFCAERRLLPLARIARDRRSLDEDVVADLERLAGRLAVVGGPPEPPARLHGDLWAGNRLFDEQGRSWLIDPAAHGGHREYDLAMMRLFGGFGEECFAAYEAAFPLAEGWRERVSLHQVAPLVVHAVKFGGSYVSAAAAAIRRHL